MDFRVPDDTQRITILGKTGSGKTVAGAWHLSIRDLDAMPWIVYDYKRDPLIEAIPYQQELAVSDLPREDSGLYVVHPLPRDTEAVTAQMWGIHERGNIGVWVDEGLMVGDHNEAFDALLTQGRSRRIPMIILSQRPVWLSRFVFSESEFFQVFHLNDKRDRQTIESFIPEEDGDLGERLPLYHSYYYDVAQDELRVMRPVPNVERILAVFEEKLRPEEDEYAEVAVRRRRLI